MSRLTTNLYPYLPKLSKEWNMLADLNNILIKQGFLKLPDEPTVTPKAPMKSSHKRKRH